nr:MAG TPA: hypothetical protein [Caudoviricetes sp.]
MICSLKVGLIRYPLFQIKPSPKTSLNSWSSKRIREGYLMP